MIRVAPGATFEATAQFGSGLAGTLGVRIRTSTGSDFLARTTAAIAADVTVGSTTVYRRAFVAPTAAGQYTLVWDDGTIIVTEELVVTSTIATPDAPTGQDYVTLEAIKNSRTLTGQTFADADLALSIASASRLVDDYTHRRFYADADADQVRIYTASRHGAIEIDDLIDLTEFATDPTGFGAYTDVWVSPDDILLDPPNAPLASPAAPYERVLVRRRVPAPGWPSGYGYGGLGGYGFGKFRWPYRIPHAVRVTGRFGWPAVPAKVQEAVMILAPRLALRKREAPWAIVGLGNESGGMRLSATDPDVCALLSRLTKDQYFA